MEGLDLISVPEGFCLWLTGLCCSGKSTTAEALRRILRDSGFEVTLLDGDQIRARLSGDLGFSPADRETHIHRVALAAAEAVRQGGVAICAVISPYRAMRAAARALFDPGRFVEIYIDTPLSVCEQRDVKGLYAEARSGLVKSFTGISDSYEPPLDPELVLKTERCSVDENVQQVIYYLGQVGRLRSSDGNRH